MWVSVHCSSSHQGYGLWEFGLQVPPFLWCLHLLRTGFRGYIYFKFTPKPMHLSAFWVPEVGGHDQIYYIVDSESKKFGRPVLPVPMMVAPMR